MDQKKNIIVYPIPFNNSVNKPAIADLIMELQSIKAEYHRFGIQLGVLPYEIVAWEQEFHRNADRMLEKILTFSFAKQKDPMENLYAALLKINQTILAEELRSKYEDLQGN